MKICLMKFILSRQIITFEKIITKLMEVIIINYIFTMILEEMSV